MNDHSALHFARDVARTSLLRFRYDRCDDVESDDAIEVFNRTHQLVCRERAPSRNRQRRSGGAIEARISQRAEGSGRIRAYIYV
jgi:hypothetical protein